MITYRKLLKLLRLPEKDTLLPALKAQYFDIG